MLVIMRYLFQLIRNYPLTIAIYIVVMYLSFFTPPRIEDLENVRFIDKWTHIVMYGGSCGVMWFEYLRRHKTVTEKIKLFLLIWLAPATFSGIIELMQEYCTGGRRSGDWYDLIANIIGVSLAALAGVLVARRRAK